MRVRVHPTAIVDPGAELGADVEIGPWALVEGGTRIGDGARLDAHAIVRRGTTLGARCRVGAFTVLGGDPQDKKYRGEPTALLVGDDATFSEHVTVHRGTAGGGGTTRLGRGGLFMVGSHVAHDCRVGDHVVFANGTLLGGHVVVGDHVVTGGHAAVAPFGRIGERAFLAAGARVEHAIPPFVIAAGDRARVRALNRVGLERSGVPEASRAALDRAFRAIFRGGDPRAVAAARLQDDPDPYVRRLAAAVLDR